MLLFHPKNEKYVTILLSIITDISNQLKKIYEFYLFWLYYNTSSVGGLTFHGMHFFTVIVKIIQKLTLKCYK